MSALRKSIDELNEMIVAFQYQEALDKFYHEDIVTWENDEKSLNGLAKYKEAGKQFADSITNYKATLLNVIVSENLTVTEWHYSFDHKQAGPWNRTQISVQRWKNGKIIHERHHYTQ